MSNVALRRGVIGAMSPVATSATPITWAGIARAAPPARRTAAMMLGLLALLLAVLLALVVWWPPAVNAGTESVGVGIRDPRSGGDGASLGVGSALRRHLVVPGDTVWELAEALAGGGDPRPVVDRIIQINGVRATRLRPGAVLLLPAAG